MALNDFDYRELITSEKLNWNYHYLDDEITDGLSTLSTQIGTQISGLGTNIDSINTSIATLSSSSAKLGSANTFTGSNTFSGAVALNGTTTAVTQAAGNNSTRVATTAFVSSAAKSGRYDNMPKYQSRSTRNANTWYHETDYSGYLFISTDVSDGHNYDAWSLLIGTSSSDYLTFKVKPSGNVPTTGRDNAAIMVPIAKGYYYKISANIGISQFYFIRTIGD